MSATDSALSRLRAYIRNGPYPPQSRLPAERELSSSLNISRSTLRNALAMLEADGEIWRHVGQGTFVGKRREHEGELLSLPADLSNPSDVMEVRLMIEPGSCALAAHRATTSDFEFMQHCLRKSEAAKDTDTFEMWDSSLHRTITESSRNALLLAVFNAVDSVRKQKIWGQLKEATLNPERKRSYMRQHSLLVSAICGRNANEAEQLMRTHLIAVRDDMLNRNG